MKPLDITAGTLINAAGIGKKKTLDAMANHQTGLRRIMYPDLHFPTFLGKVDGVEHIELEKDLRKFDCRNNKLAKLALDTDGFRQAIQVAIEKYGSDRIGVFIGTSTSGIAETENAYKHQEKNGQLAKNFDMLHTHNIGSAQTYIQCSLGLNGVALSISTACSSSAKVFAAASRYIEAGLCDSAIVGGVDSLCLTTLYGFNALQLISMELCKPCDRNRNGINIGEAAGFMLLEKPNVTDSRIQFKGFGESSDAYHMSTPHPNGNGAKMAMQRALTSAQVSVDDIDYINLHGTATPSNDLAESRGIAQIFPVAICCSSTKSITGHTLGAAGITEAIICVLALEHRYLPGTVNLKNYDDDLTIKPLMQGEHAKCRYVLSNSFGFGGNNCSLIFGA